VIASSPSSKVLGSYGRGSTRTMLGTLSSTTLSLDGLQTVYRQQQQAQSDICALGLLACHCAAVSLNRAERPTRRTLGTLSSTTLAPDGLQGSSSNQPAQPDLSAL
jgi:hypothetical protein